MDWQQLERLSLLALPISFLVFAWLAFVYWGRAEAKKLAWQAVLWLVALNKGNPGAVSEEQATNAAANFYAFLPLMATRGLASFTALAFLTLQRFKADYSGQRALVKAYFGFSPPQKGA